MKSQYQLIDSFGVTSTWLLQYQVLKDTEAINFFKDKKDNIEIGLFLEEWPDRTPVDRLLRSDNVDGISSNPVCSQ